MCFLQTRSVICSPGCCEGPAWRCRLLFIVPCSICQSLRAVVCAFHSAVRSLGYRATSLPVPSLNFKPSELLSAYLLVILDKEDLEDVLKTWLIKCSISFLPFPSPLPKHRFPLRGGLGCFTIYLHFWNLATIWCSWLQLGLFSVVVVILSRERNYAGFQVLE